MGQKQSGFEKLENTLEIRDSALDATAFRQAVAAGLAYRRATGAYNDDLASVVRTVFGEEAAPDEAMGDPRVLPELVAALATSWPIQELPFISRVPVFGRLIVLVRNAWNWMSTQWYVRPLMQQQVVFNALATRTIATLAASQVELAERLSVAEAEVMALQIRLAATEETSHRGDMGEEAKL
jgi:hypothetical protein